VKIGHFIPSTGSSSFSHVVTIKMAVSSVQSAILPQLPQATQPPQTTAKVDAVKPAELQAMQRSLTGAALKICTADRREE